MKEKDEILHLAHEIRKGPSFRKLAGVGKAAKLALFEAKTQFKNFLKEVEKLTR